MPAVTSYSTQVFGVIEPSAASCPPVAAGLLFQVIPVSVQVFAVGKTIPPTTLPSVQKRRSLADATGPESADRLKRR